ncbi:glycosyltransferase family 4 protein [uncultured Amaricoccus sp.]|uniref:glycosyltransferase family 4 protein n=1 Tax=uncultured Amaricoccus sp. TaxID=339341 RepID=UPI00261A896C|nr:glycosyltransferase family 4 protein [uncultured Amaricoccus sp.]
MRILTVVAGMGVGGTERAAQNLSLGLKALGVEVAVLAHAERGRREAAYRAAGVGVFGPGEEVAAAGWGADVVHIHRSGYANARETALLRVLKRPAARVVETNVFARFDAGEGGALIDVHCLLSRWCAWKWSAWGGAAARGKAMAVLPNPVDGAAIARVPEAERAEVRARLGVPPGRFLFGRVGQPHAAKWSPAVLGAFAAVVGRGFDAGLLLVGAPGEIAEGVGRLPAGVRERVVSLPVTGCDRRLSELLTAMDGFLHLSRIGESFGMVLCEAMLCGVPVVTLSTPLKDNSQLEVVGHGVGGLVALRPDAVPEAMTALMADAGLRERVRLGGADWVSGRFGVEAVSRRALGIYEAALAGGPVERPAVGAGWLAAIGGQGIGRPPGAAGRAVFRLLHVPAVYRGYLALARGGAG